MAEPRPSKLEVYRDREVAQAYDKRWSSPAGMRRDVRKAKLLKQALKGFPSARTLLDIPCGTARFAQDLAPQYTWIGADLSVPMLNAGRHKSPNESFLCADLAHLPFSSKSFDVAVCIRLFHLVRDPKLRHKFLRELHRVSRCGVICGWHHDRSFKILGRRWRHRLGWRKTPPSNPSMHLIREEMEGAGFVDQEWFPLRKTPFTSNKVLVRAGVGSR